LNVREQVVIPKSVSEAQPMCFVFKLSTTILVQTLIFRKINPPHLMELASSLRISNWRLFWV
jgi:hypothetical protein